MGAMRAVVEEERARPSAAACARACVLCANGFSKPSAHAHDAGLELQAPELVERVLGDEQAARVALGGEGALAEKPVCRS